MLEVRGRFSSKAINEGFNVVLVGMGGWGKNHLKTLNTNEFIGSICIYDPAITQEKISISPSRKLRLLENLDFEHDKFDLAIIATPAATHPEIAELFLKQGVPTLVEKPLATTKAKSSELYAIAKQRDVFLGVGFQYRWHPATTAITSLIETSGSRHKAMYYRSERTQGLRRPDADVILDLAIHDIALATHFFDSSATGVVLQVARTDDNGILGGCSFELKFGAFHRAYIVVDWQGKKCRRFSLETEMGTWCVDEVAAPGQMIGPKRIGDAKGKTSIPEGVSLARQQAWLLKKAADLSFCDSTAKFNGHVMEAVDLIQSEVSTYLQGKQIEPPHH